MNLPKGDIDYFIRVDCFSDIDYFIRVVTKGTSSSKNYCRIPKFDTTKELMFTLEN